MKYVLLGSLGNITKPLAQKLVAAKHQVTVISSKTAKAAEIEKLGATAAIGDLNDTDFLTRTFKGADAVYTMVPPGESENRKQQMRREGNSLVAAVKAAGIKKVLNLSSIGAHMPAGCGPVSALYFVEQAFNALDGVDVKHLRPAFFYTNLLNNIGMIKHAGIYGNNYGLDTDIVFVHPDDIAVVAAEELQALSFTGKTVRYIVDDIRTSKEVASILGNAIGKPELPYVQFTDEQALQGMVQAGLNEDSALNYVEMGQAIRSGEMFAEYKKEPVQQGPVKLEDFAKAFAAVYAKS